MSPPVNPDENEFTAYAESSGVPVASLIFRSPNDGVLAWSAFASLEKDSEYAFLLESAATGEHGRYSFMGVSPRRLLFFKDGEFSVCDGEGKTIQKESSTDPLLSLQNYMSTLSVPPPSEDDNLPPFLGGVVGYMGYDCVHSYEQIGEMKPDILDLPDMTWMLTDILVIFDHYRHEVYIVKSCYAEDTGGDWRGAYREGLAEATELLSRMSENAPRLQLFGSKSGRKLEIESNMDKKTFCMTVESLLEHIRAGDIFQAVPSQRLSFIQEARTLDIYRCLRRMNPSPYMFYLKCGDFVTAGASPELMIWRSGSRIILRPIAGTRRRGETREEDSRLELELLSDEKEMAEHMMLVDLGRNDIGKVSEAGGVEVTSFHKVEKYSHVMHMVSTVEGRLRGDCTGYDGLRASFPAGTLSGAPKVRAMQLINEHEPCKRHIYGGCAGYAGYDGGMMTCITIRSFVSKSGRCYVQAGGGVVSDSEPEKEYEESMNKAAAVLRAAELALEELEVD